MKKKNPNERYIRERRIMGDIFGDILSPTPFSGGRKLLGTQDGESEHFIVQVKSTCTNSVRLTFDMFFDLLVARKSTQVPLLVLDFINPKHGVLTLPDEQWIAMRVSDFQKYCLQTMQEGGTIPNTTE